MQVRETVAGGAGLLREARQAVGQLVLYRGVLDDPIGRALVAVLDQATARGANVPGLVAAYGHLFGLLAEAAELGHGPLVGDAWQDHMLGRILTDDNLFSRKAQRPDAPMGGALLETVRRDLAALHRLYHLHAAAMLEALVALDPDDLAPILLSWADLAPLDDARSPEIVRAMRWLADAPSWPGLVPDLAAYYRDTGAGLFARYHALRWTPGEDGGTLVGVEWPDPVRLADLVGYETERRPLLRNTEQFLAGYRANNALLYGDRGTGKSSTIKALVNEYAAQGLRLIEVPRRALDDLPAVMRQVRGRRERFIIYVDDLAFGDAEERHLDLKVLLEGGLEHHPENAVVYVTSNRRHLMREYFTPDRGLLTPDNEIRPGETVQEQLSLADRFGLVVTFLAPTQDRYLAIVAALAQQAGLQMPPETLRRRALQWATQHNGLSGRTARQFIDNVAGEQGLARHEKGAGPAA
jgi:predicted AAA+ superfamily ATPase